MSTNIFRRLNSIQTSSNGSRLRFGATRSRDSTRESIASLRGAWARSPALAPVSSEDEASEGSRPCSGSGAVSANHVCTGSDYSLRKSIERFSKLQIDRTKWLFHQSNIPSIELAHLEEGGGVDNDIVQRNEQNATQRRRHRRRVPVGKRGDHQRAAKNHEEKEKNKKKSAKISRTRATMRRKKTNRRRREEPDPEQEEGKESKDQRKQFCSHNGAAEHHALEGSRAGPRHQKILVRKRPIFQSRLAGIPWQFARIRLILSQNLL